MCKWATEQGVAMIVKRQILPETTNIRSCGEPWELTFWNDKAQKKECGFC